MLTQPVCTFTKLTARAATRDTSSGFAPAKPCPAPSTVMNSCTTPALLNFASMSFDREYGTSVSAVPWINIVGGYFPVILRIGQYRVNQLWSVCGSCPETCMGQSPFCRQYK